MPDNENTAQDSDTTAPDTWAGSTNDLATEPHGWLDITAPPDLRRTGAVMR